MTESLDNVFVLRGADALGVPLVMDSPHSGTFCPPDFGTIAPVEALMTSCDAFVDELWSGVVQKGGALLAARFHRAYVDANRARSDIDPGLLAEPWPTALDLSDYTRRGMGLIRRHALPGVPMYVRKLTVAEVELRLTHFFDPYHAALSGVIDSAGRRFGRVWHVNCHSMKSVGNAMNLDNGNARPDMVVGDLEGLSADPAFTRWAAGALRELGYRVTINDPYSGADILRRYGRAGSRCQSIQIEINRSLYMNEETFAKTAGFLELKRNLDLFVSHLVTYIQTQLSMPIPVLEE